MIVVISWDYSWVENNDFDPLMTGTFALDLG
jgi:hypothetical protein